MAIRERSDSYQIDVSVRRAGKRIRHREQFSGTKADAQVREGVIKGLMAAGMQVVEDAKAPTHTSLREAFRMCDKRYWDGTPSGVNNARLCKEFMDFAGSETDINSLTTRQLDEYAGRLTDQGLAASTINSKLSVISKMLTHYQDELDKKPRVPFPKGRTNKRVRFLTDFERDGILTFLKDRWGHSRIKVRAGTPTAVDWYDFFAFYLDTGCRPSETRKINERDLDGACVHIWDTKNGEARTLPLTKRSLAGFTRQAMRAKQRGHMTPFEYATNHAIRAVWDEIRTYLKMDDDPEFVPYVCRHDCATRLYRATRDLLVVQQWMGHSNINQTLTYAKLFPTALMEARDALETQDANTGLRAIK